MTRFGVHTGLQHTTADELRLLWKRIEALGFDWISIWDHFYAGTGDPRTRPASRPWRCTPRWPARRSACECGALVYSIGYRHPAVLAKAVTAIDHISGGRAAMGLGAGWAVVEYRAYGIDFPAAGPGWTSWRRAWRSSAALLPRRGDDVRRHVVPHDRRRATSRARSGTPCRSGSVAMGERRTLRIAARYADGWNCPFPSPPTFAAKRDVLRRHCDDVGRDPTEIRCAVNVGLAWTEESLRGQFGNITEVVRPGVLTGSVDQVVDRIGEYVAAGADQVNLALRAPFDVDALERFSEALSLP